MPVSHPCQIADDTPPPLRRGSAIRSIAFGNDLEGDREFGARAVLLPQPDKTLADFSLHVILSVQERYKSEVGEIKKKFFKKSFVSSIRDLDLVVPEYDHILACDLVSVVS